MCACLQVIDCGEIKIMDCITLHALCVELCTLATHIVMFTQLLVLAAGSLLLHSLLMRIATNIAMHINLQIYAKN